MSVRPDRYGLLVAAKKRGRATGATAATSPQPCPSSDDAYEVAFFRRHKDDDAGETVPGREFLNSLPPAVAARIRAVVIAVAESPPHKFAGGGKWEAMHGAMAGIYEVRADGPPNRTHYRLFCVLDTKAQGRGPLLVIIDGTSKPFRTEVPQKVYDRVSRLRDEYLKRPKRSLV
jgi:hypothetical protein